MSAISDQLMRSALSPWLGVHGQPVKILTGADNGLTFNATLVIAEPNELTGEVVQDLRERTLAVFDSLSYPANTKPGDTMKDSDGNVWRFGKRVSNPTNVSVEFEVTIVTKKDL